MSTISKTLCSNESNICSGRQFFPSWQGATQATRTSGCHHVPIWSRYHVDGAVVDDPRVSDESNYSADGVDCLEEHRRALPSLSKAVMQAAWTSLGNLDSLSSLTVLILASIMVIVFPKGVRRAIHSGIHLNPFVFLDGCSWGCNRIIAPTLDATAIRWCKEHHLHLISVILLQVMSAQCKQHRVG